MTRKILALCLFIAVVAVLPALAEPLAVRVEVEVLGPASGGARVAVTVQVSPEDRGRIGANAMLRIELDGEAPPGQSPMWAVRMEDDGSARIETVWPSGEHELQVRISSPSGRDSGLWVGEVRIPDPGASPVEAPAPSAAPTPTPRGTPAGPPAVALAPVPVAEPQVATADAGGEPRPGEAAAPPPAAADAAENVPPAPEPTTVAEAGPAPEAAAQLDPPAVEQPVPEDKAPTGDEPTAFGVTAAGSPVVAEAPPVEEVVEPIVEPLRAEPSAPADVPPASAPAAPALPPPEAAAAAAAAWAADADAAGSELTAVVLEGREPARGLRPSDLRLRVNGAEVSIEALGEAGEAPLFLGVAVDAGPDSGIGWPGGGDLAPLITRARDGLGKTFYAASGDPVGGWGAGPPASAPGGTGGDVASLIVDSLRRFDGVRGRRFLLVVTDGRNQPDKESWKQAVTAAGEAGTPVLVVALWDEGFSRRTRNNLREIAEVSGGSLFLVQGG
ncbi:MAG TPA: hypothetical protein VLT81_09975, partial [Chondromyces sp.]|nr:hypothetical protein [Chondromyces sp.]